jgi:hypothetical protein
MIHLPPKSEIHRCQPKDAGYRSHRGPSSDDNFASPSLGDGWMVSDSYLWMHALAGMGKTQEWMTCLEPAYIPCRQILPRG